jgi:dipeptidyl aminopeptidase/acylaminoacyl peptidase
VSLKSRWRLAHAMVLCAGLAGPLAARPFTESDALNYEPQGAALFDPAGRRVVFERADPYQKAPDFPSGGPFRQGRTTLWLMDVNSGAEPELLFPQDADTSYWLGAFAPDGQRLAFVEFRSERERLCIIELFSRRVSCSTLTPELFTFETSFLWRTNTELLVILPPSGRQPRLLANTRLSAEQMPALWAKALAGKEATADVVYSGAAAAHAPVVTGSLARLDALTGNVETLTTGSFVEMRLSPDRHYVALLERHNIVERDPKQQLTAQETGTPPLSVRLVSLAGQGVRQDVKICTQCLVAGNNLTWSSDSSSIAFLAKLTHEPWPIAARAYRFDVRSARQQEIAADQLKIAAGREMSTWAGQSIAAMGTDIVFRASYKGGDPKLYHVSSKGRIRPLTADQSDDGGELVAVGRHAALLLKDHKAWRVGLNGQKTQVLADSGAQVERLSGHWSRGTFYVNKSVLFQRYAWLKLENQGRISVARLDLDSGDLRLSPSFDSSVSALGVDDEHGDAVLIDDKTPATVWLSRPEKSAFQVMRLNQYMADVTLATSKRIEYTDQKGVTRNAWLALPPDSPHDVKLPLVVEVYRAGGLTYNPLEWWATYTINPELLVAHGYAYLFVGVPISPEGVGSEPRTEMLDPVMRAIDATIAAAPIDANKLALFGHSFGHFTALSVLSGTQRFKVAAIASGFTDTPSHFGTFAANLRVHAQDYLEYAMFGSGWAEGGQGRMGSAPWQDPERYIRNSPNFNADKINTPLMLVHGDLDDISMSQSEEMFVALHRLNRDAEFVRYWGEGHLILSPANLLDLWSRLEGWYRTHGVAPGTVSQ